MAKKLIKAKGHGGVYFWMQRLANEYRVKATELIKEAEDLHWQTYNWENMSEQVQDQVLLNLCEKMIKQGWEKEVQEYFGKEMKNEN